VPTFFCAAVLVSADAVFDLVRFAGVFDASGVIAAVLVRPFPDEAGDAPVSFFFARGGAFSVFAV
jgi:hypothetical protein